MDNIYQYPTLIGNEIRIAELLPASNASDPLRCRLLPVSLNSSPPPRYNALSYTWGDTTQCAPITVDSEDRSGFKGRHIGIRKNLDAALRRIRKKDAGLWMWIDSICINQGGIEERGRQAGMMKNIYQNSSEVYVWLGIAENESPSAWKLILDIVNSKLDSTLEIIKDTSRSPQFRALHALFRRPYWSRIWVVQEVNSGGKKVTVYCGEDSMSWTRLELVCDRLREANKVLASNINPSDATSNNTLLNGGPKSLQLTRFSAERDTPNLFELLLAHKSKDSTDARDKIYALVGLSRSDKTFGFLNYEWSEREAFIHTARHIIRTTDTLDVICVQQNDDNKYDLPSWVPDWERRNKPPSHRIMGLHIRRPPFKASGQSKPIYTFLENGYVLNVRGYIVDTIGQIGQPFHMNGDEPADSKIIQTLSICQTWWEMYSNTRGSKANTQEFSSTIYGGEWAAYSEPLPPDQRFQSLFCLAKTLLPPEKDIRLLPAQTAGTDKDHRAMASAASLRMHGKLFAMSTEQKLACLAPLDTLKGDCICVVLGCSFPPVLRPFEKQYWLVGETYVHDIMRGETMKDFQTGKYKEEDFALK